MDNMSNFNRKIGIEELKKIKEHSQTEDWVLSEGFFVLPSGVTPKPHELSTFSDLFIKELLSEEVLAETTNKKQNEIPEQNHTIDPIFQAIYNATLLLEEAPHRKESSSLILDSIYSYLHKAINIPRSSLKTPRSFNALLTQQQENPFHEHTIKAVWLLIFFGSQRLYATPKIVNMTLACLLCKLSLVHLIPGGSKVDLDRQNIMSLDGPIAKAIYNYPLLSARWVRKFFERTPHQVLEYVERHRELPKGQGFPQHLDTSSEDSYNILNFVFDFSLELVKKGSDPQESLAQRMVSFLRQNGKLYDHSLFPFLIQSVQLYPSGTLLLLKNKRCGLVTPDSNALSDEPEIYVLRKRKEDEAANDYIRKAHKEVDHNTERVLCTKDSPWAVETILNLH